jgi:hypothetical protein
VKIAEDEESEAAPKGGEVSNKCPPDDKAKAFWNGYWSAAHNIAADIKKLHNDRLEPQPRNTTATLKGK